MQFPHHLAVSKATEGDVEAACRTILLLFFTIIDTAFPSNALRQSIPKQACMDTSLSEIYAVVDPRPGLPGLAIT